MAEKNGEIRTKPWGISILRVNLILMLATLVLLFVLIEVGFRIDVYFESRKSFERLMQKWSQPENGIAQHLGQLIQPSPDARIIYELRPDMSVNFVNVLVKTNRQGFRNGPLVLKKDKNTVRIVGLGDSFMFGWGVPQEKMYLAVLGDMLNSRFPQKRWEVINTGVPGYNTYMEVETLSKKGLVYDPDIVMVEYIGNDMALPNFLRDSPDCFSLNRSFFIDFLTSKFRPLKVDAGLVVAPMNVLGIRPEDDLDRIPERYRYMCGFKAFQKSMIQLKKMQEKKGFEVVICFTQQGLITKEAFEWMQALCKKLNFYVLVDIQIIAPSLVLSRDDSHPSELAHKLKAEVLADFMIREKIIKKHESAKPSQ